jgi:hypothetical protein
MHDFEVSALGTCANNSRLISMLTHQQGVLASTPHKFFCWHKGHWLLSMVDISTISFCYFILESSITSRTVKYLAVISVAIFT